jgi:RNA polymerase sigma factor (sigma-70 family)
LWSTSERNDNDTALGVALRKQRADRVLETLGTLPPRERVAICMKLLDDASQRDIARALELSEGYVSKLIQRGLRRIADAGWEIDDVED